MVFRNIIFTYLHAERHLYFIKKNSYLFHLEPINALHGITVGADDAAVFLRNVTISIREFIYYKAFQVFKDVVPPHKLNNLLIKIRDRLSPRVSALNIGSFEVGLGIDTVAITNEYNNVDDNWKNNLLEEFKNEVIDVDYNSEEDAAIIAEKFDPVTRKKIYEPYIKALDTKEYVVSVNDIAKKPIRQYRQNPIKERVKNIVVPKPNKEEVAAEQDRIMKLYQFVVRLEEGQDVSNIKIKDLRDNLLFGDVQPEASYTIHSPLEVNDKTYTLKSDIKGKFVVNPDGSFKIYHSELEIEVEGQDFKKVEESYKENLAATIEAYAEIKDEVILKSNPVFVELRKYV